MGVLDTSQLAQWAWQHGDADEPGLVEVGEHALGDPGLEHSLLEVVAVDEQRREHRLELVEGARSDPTDVDRRVGEVGDDRVLGVRVAAGGRVDGGVLLCRNIDLPGVTWGRHWRRVDAGSTGGDRCTRRLAR